MVCDGGSSDGTVEYIQNIIDHIDTNGISMEVHSGKDRGMYDALAKGFKIAGYNYDVYCYINAGDYFSPYAFEVVSEVLTAGNEWFTGATVIYNERGFITDYKAPLDYNTQLIKEGAYGSVLPFIQQESTFWSLRLHKKIDVNKLSDFSYAGDFYLWKTFSEYSDLSTLNVWLSGFRKHEGQLSSVFTKEYFKEFDSVREKRSLSTLIKAWSLYIINKAPSKIRKNWQRKIIEL